MASACIPPASTIAGLLLGQTDNTAKKINYLLINAKFHYKRFLGFHKYFQKYQKGFAGLFTIFLSN